ncbi:hypothetical protein B6A42_26110 (plasmid) [Vibrio coralliilyticus]|nr:hypothetical protein B6A42_26110 [Vibrio coralliilyticus]
MVTLLSHTWAPITLLSALLLGCHSDPTPNANSRPLANYTFSDHQLSQLLTEKESMIKATQLTYDGTTYTVAYATGDDEDALLLFQNHDATQSVSLLIPKTPVADSQCTLVQYAASERRQYTYHCGTSQVSQTSDIITYMGRYQGKSSVLIPDAADFVLEVHEGVDTIGSTQLVLSYTGDHAEIRTQNPFDGYHPLGASDLGVTTYLQLKRLADVAAGRDITLIFNSPIGGSSDDAINMYTGRLIRQRAMHTQIAATGSVFSGGTDLFTAGITRTLVRRDTAVPLQTNRQIGVHAWADKNAAGQVTPATAIPYTDQAHRAQATYFTEMLGDKGIDFYLFTLSAAPHDGEHLMTRQELDTYQITTAIR